MNDRAGKIYETYLLIIDVLVERRTKLLIHLHKSSSLYTLHSFWIFKFSFFVLICVVFAQNLFLYLIPLGLPSLVIWIVLEKVQALFYFKIVVQADVMRDLVLLFNQIELLDHTHVVSEFVFAHRKEFFYRVLDASLDLAIV